MAHNDSRRGDIATRLLKEAGTTYDAREAGITLKDTPMPLFELLVLCMLASKPIDAGIAVAAAREVFHAGLRTPEAVRDADRKTMIDAFGRAGYARYDENAAAAAKLLQQFKGIGTTGSDIFLREVQDTWTWVRPYYDERARGAAEQLGLPTDPQELSALAAGRDAEFAAALVRASLDDDLRAAVV
ncbi:endonuclease [Mycobacterium sp. Root135]|uniref:hypothetical protein n=1 Tax=Mycobacterium sp. Root135 TaxID=1736457 RepID=UPI0006F75F5F|nr:hypothetical protein [Mycobacterium sp. Root135]KQY09065.1 endonuclease [Mycobacterium sp. Root135]